MAESRVGGGKRYEPKVFILKVDKEREAAKAARCSGDMLAVSIMMKTIIK